MELRDETKIQIKYILDLIEEYKDNLKNSSPIQKNTLKSWLQQGKSKKYAQVMFGMKSGKILAKML